MKLRCPICGSHVITYDGDTVAYHLRVTTELDRQENIKLADKVPCEGGGKKGAAQPPLTQLT